MFEKWIAATPAEIGMVMVNAVITYAAILLYTRLAGLRSFSKMSASDFAMTVAVGSLFASTISSAQPTLLLGLCSLALLFLGQWCLSRLRYSSNQICNLVDNQPLLLMHGGTILDDNLSRANVTKADLFGKLREANALNFDEVLAVVFESTGDVSVMHSCDEDAKLAPEFFKNVIDADQITRYRDK